jgi:HEAT repeat protein
MFARLRRRLGFDREAVLLRRLRHRDPYRAQLAMREVAWLPCSDAIIEALESSPYSRWAIETLGQIADPRASAALVRKLAQSPDERDDACIALSGEHHDPAVPALEALALNDTDYHVVEAATKALAGVGTPWAVTALERFRQQPARPLRYHDHAEDDTLVSSDRLAHRRTATGSAPTGAPPARDGRRPPAT